MAFVHLHLPDAVPTARDLGLVIQGDRLLARLEAGGAVVLPEVADLAEAIGSAAPRLHVGTIDGRACWLWVVDEAAADAPAGWVWQETRPLLGVFTAAQSQAVSCARQLDWWDRRHRFCGACGTATLVVREERARRCPSCAAVFFPAGSPAVIVAVTRGEELLLAHNRNFRPGLFSVLAGFVEPGETLEQAAIREVREEVGVEIAELSYVMSEPWAFPNSLMVGFRARAVGGEIAVDGREIEHAAWFRRDALPETPRPGTAAHWLIADWRRGA